MKLRNMYSWFIVGLLAFSAVLGFSQITSGGDDSSVPAPPGEVKDAAPPAGGPGGVSNRGVGGPDLFGYTYDSGVPYQMIDISGSGALVVSGDDVSSGPLALGGDPFNHYGTLYASLVMASNGYISTDPTDGGPDLSNDCPLPATPSTGGGGRIYPLHDDLVTNTGYYEYFASCPRPSDLGGDLGCNVFMWDDATHFGAAVTFDVEVILYDMSFEIVCLIGPGNPETGSGSTTGIQNDGATIGLTFACDTGGSIPDNTVVAFFNPEGSVVVIPTLGTWALIVFALLLLSTGVVMMRKRRFA